VSPRPYLTYKPSGIEWLGDIPIHWKVRRLKFIAPFSMKKLASRPKKLPYIGLEHIESKTGRLLLNEPVENVEGVVNYFRSGSVLFGKLRPYLAKVAYPNFSGVCTTELLVLEPIKEVVGKFIFYQLLSDGFIKLIDSMTYGAKMPRTNIEQVGNMIFALPPETEQRVIAAYLDQEVARINALITTKQELVSTLQEKRKAIIRNFVTRGLNSAVPREASNIEWLGDIPAHWETRRLKYLVTFVGGGTPSKDNPSFWSGNIPWVSPKDMKHPTIRDTEEYVTEEGVASGATKLVGPGVTLIVVRSGILRHSIPVAITERKVAINQDMKALISKPSLAASYLSYFIQGCQDELLFEWRKEGATVESIEFELLANMRIPLPPLAEQYSIVSFLNEETTRLDTLIDANQDTIKKLQEYHTTLISAAVTGKLDLREQKQ